jgi:hypothetical protein
MYLSDINATHDSLLKGWIKLLNFDESNIIVKSVCSARI